MEKLFFRVIILSIALILTCCEKEQDPFQISMLKKSWTHSYEEDTSENYDIYRPSDYKIFPASWFRQIFYFNIYASNKMLRRAVEREFEIIGEAMNRIERFDPKIEISSKKQIINMRN